MFSKWKIFDVQIFVRMKAEIKGMEFTRINTIIFALFPREKWENCLELFLEFPCGGGPASYPPFWYTCVSLFAMLPKMF